MGSSQSTLLPVHKRSQLQLPAPSPAPSESTTTLSPTANYVPAGYPKLAERMSCHPEQTIVRSFAALNAENMFYLQAELVHLEKELKKVQLVDSLSQQGSRNMYARSWYALSHPQDLEAGRQWQLIQRIREKLKEYSKLSLSKNPTISASKGLNRADDAVIRQHVIHRMKSPDAFDLNQVQKYLETTDMGPFALFGLDSSVWGSVDKPNTYAADLISLSARHDEDSFSKWVTDKATKILFRFGLPRSTKIGREHGDRSFYDEDLLRWSRTLTSIVASALPIASIVLLRFVQSSDAKLVIITVFNALLSLCLGFFTKARSIDLFAVSAAFSAVQVVFVQAGVSTCGK